jgi:hypothetical protein
MSTREFRIILCAALMSTGLSAQTTGAGTINGTITDPAAA